MNYHIVNIEQGTPEWLNARKGKLTASQAKDIITPTGKLAAASKGLMRKLARECLLDDPLEFTGNAATQWGHDHEPIARDAFTDLTGHAVDTVGLLQSTLHPCLACSPDGLLMTPSIMVDGELTYDIHGLEIKCPNVDTHVDYLLDGELPAKYRPQVHFSMAITGIQTWYFMSYFPGLKPLILPVHWDEYTDKIKSAALAFAAEYEQEMPKILNAIRP
jgi:putative phage-type endonuclease